MQIHENKITGGNKAKQNQTNEEKKEEKKDNQLNKFQFVKKKKGEKSLSDRCMQINNKEIYALQRVTLNTIDYD